MGKSNDLIQAQESLELLLKNSDIDISPVSEPVNLLDSTLYKKIDLSSSDKMKIAGLTEALCATKVASNINATQLFTVSFPAGLPHTLMQLHSGGFGAAIMGSQGIIGTAAYIPVATAPMAALAALSAVSSATNQFALAQIANTLDIVSQKVDKIMEYLYGTKRAELLAEIEFVKSAYKNYQSIMSHEEQRIPTILSLQNARKIAIKNIRFDLDELLKIPFSKDSLLQQSEMALNWENDLVRATQLFSTSYLLEAYYSYNTDKVFLENIYNSVVDYTENSKAIRSDTFSKLEQSWTKKFSKSDAQKALEKVFSKKTNEEKAMSNILKKAEELRNTSVTKELSFFRDTLFAICKPRNYITDNKGNVYFLTA